LLDTVLKMIALTAFAAFAAFLPAYVPGLDLLAVIVIVVGMAAYDFFVRPMMRGRRR
jgi:Na+/H+ antiporter NhaB